MWNEYLSNIVMIPLVNADRMMTSIFPEDPLPTWAKDLRDNDNSWMMIARKGVEAFVAQAMTQNVPFAMETVFSHWRDLGGGKFESKIDLIKQMQAAGYFVLLIFVGLSSHELSEARVQTRVKVGGHNVDQTKLVKRFPRTQHAIKTAIPVADAAILVDNSREPLYAYTVCHVQMGTTEIYDCRNDNQPPASTLLWLNVVCPRR